ncbi:hypothetical protein PCANC_20632 [Puccinia coronata f. sp. avenae]|uniref:Uncharacterized protein n=1 Tax=Puccinia coronata f. sp. avenae TaxID=200324 RepID=A0A2N5SIY2_9BASI|nr:hypothetical protein PCANC_20632 [Puccinia coronata f. sp. avenae]
MRCDVEYDVNRRGRLTLEERGAYTKRWPSGHLERVQSTSDHTQSGALGVPRNAYKSTILEVFKLSSPAAFIHINAPSDYHTQSRLFNKMLFKYFLAPIALAAAAVAYGESSDAASKGIDFQVIVKATEKLTDPIVKSSGKDNVADVVKEFSSIYVPVLEISKKFHSVDKLEKTFVSEQAKFFFSFLQKFELIIKAIADHPRVLQGCHDKIPEFNTQFGVIITDLKKYNIDFKGALAGIKLDVSLWVKIGFNFQNLIGIPL